MAWEEREVDAFVDHHHGGEDPSIQRIVAMSVANVGIMREIVIVTGVAAEAGAGMYTICSSCSFCFESSSFLTVQYFISDTVCFWVLIF